MRSKAKNKEIGNINIRLPGKIKEEFRSIAKQTGRSMAGLGLYIIYTYLEEIRKGVRKV